MLYCRYVIPNNHSDSHLIRVGQDKPKINELLREAGETQTVDKLDIETLEALKEGIDQTLGRYM